ncbi:MAG TPA: prephenate/arogenate dehydrogenase family protein [Dongiaceae bacterium]|jgi:cyclohexadieny/prephenate dehydrogenase|nr:prephenate/arogenate dehydrogenase family protein [Dongiaceae bacterium]
MNPLCRQVAIIGIGLIGSSLARGIRKGTLADIIHIADKDPQTLQVARELNLGDHYHSEAAQAVAQADLVILCTPVGTYGEIGAAIGPHMKDGAVLTDVGSVKGAIMDALAPYIRPGVAFVPAHPLAGTEHSGPEAGFADLFQGRWTILIAGAPASAMATVTQLWERLGSQVEVMDRHHHDQILAIVSHLPHLIAYTIVGTAVGLEDSAKREVIKFSASGFRDFTRIAASDPIMWRDIFLNNREAVLEMLGRFTEDLAALQKAIRFGEGDKLEELFTRTRAIRRGIIDARQA